MQDFTYFRPKTIAELKENLRQPGALMLAGGTDLIPKMRRNNISPPILVDSSGLSELDFIDDDGDQIVIGALATHQDIAQSRLIRDVNPALREAAQSVGCIQTRSRGTLGGNIANASPAADTIPALLVYDAVLLVQSLEGERSISLESFIHGPGKSDLVQGEFIQSISFTPFSGQWGSKFIKIGKRTGMAIAVVNAAASLVLDQTGLIAEVRIALGAVGPVVIRCRETEKSLIGRVPSADIFKEAGERVREEIRPIQDLRSTEGYRLHSAGVILTRALEAAAEQAVGRTG
jgi:carbon-monoxide dehydrogenase medium subunit